MKSIDLTAIIQAFIMLISSVITIYIIPKVKSYLAAKLTAEQRENLKQWVKVAVAAAEQIYNGSGLGTDKYRYVVDFLKRKGIYVNCDEVTALIESEVYKLTHGSGYFVTAPEEEMKLTGDTNMNDTCEPAEVLNEYCGDGNGLSEEPEPDTADEECETDTVEAVG